MRDMRDTERERLERIARRAADLVNAIYEFDFDPATIDEPLNCLDDVLVEAGYRPPCERWEDLWNEDMIEERELVEYEDVVDLTFESRFQRAYTEQGKAWEHRWREFGGDMADHDYGWSRAPEHDKTI